MTLRCPLCNATFAEGALYCAHDGTKLIEDVPRAARAAGGALDGSDDSVAGDARRAELRAIVGQTLGGRYRILKKIGEGGMSLVYLASDETTGERLALKVLAPQLVSDAGAMERLKLEAEMGSALTHPNVCHILGVGTTERGVVYIVMPYVAGESLYDRTTRLGELTLEQTLPITGDVARGLQVAHGHGIVHRDLKPENVMLSPTENGGERAVVMDFGLAKQRRVSPAVRKLTKTGIVLGTPEFMSPEQLRGKPLDARSDVYSLGLMAYEMLSGRLPFIGRTQQDVMMARLRSDPTPLAQMRGDLRFPPGVDAVFAKCLARAPEDRYASAPEFAAALERAAAGGERKTPSWITRILNPDDGSREP